MAVYCLDVKTRRQTGDGVPQSGRLNTYKVFTQGKMDEPGQRRSAGRGPHGHMVGHIKGSLLLS